jgi:hypothetical protein
MKNSQNATVEVFRNHYFKILEKLSDGELVYRFNAQVNMWVNSSAEVGYVWALLDAFTSRGIEHSMNVFDDDWPYTRCVLLLDNKLVPNTELPDAFKQDLLVEYLGWFFPDKMVFAPKVGGYQWRHTGRFRVPVVLHFGMQKHDGRLCLDMNEMIRSFDKIKGLGTEYEKMN